MTVIPQSARQSNVPIPPFRVAKVVPLTPAQVAALKRATPIFYKNGKVL